MPDFPSEFISVQEGGDNRVLAARPVAEGSVPTFGGVFGETPTTRLIPRADWRPVDLSPFVSPIKDQRDIGACNAFATVNCLEACRRMVGLPDVRLSPGDLYSRINGGRDNGSLPEDALKTMLESGVAMAAEVPELHWRGVFDTPAIRASRPKYRFLEALWCPTFEHAASALQQGFLLDTAVWWYGSDPVDADGWLQNRGGGSQGGHAIMGCGLMERSGRWGIKIGNSWSRAWGRDGFGILPEQRCIEGTKVFRWWALRAVVNESDAPDLPEPKFT